MQYAVPVVEALSDWTSTVDELSFDDACNVLGDLHSVSTLVRSLELDVIGSLVANHDVRSLHNYLCLHLALTRSDAKERVAVATALLELPLLKAAFRNGKLDWAHLVLVTQLAETPEEDFLYSETAQALSLNQLRTMLARKKAGDATANERAFKERSLGFRHDDKKQRSKLTSDMPLDIALALEKVLQQRADSFGLDAETGEYLKPQQALLDALCDIVFGEEAPKADMLIDLEPSAMTGDGKADLEGHTISRETLHRLSCDASIRASFIDEFEIPVKLARAQCWDPGCKSVVAQQVGSLGSCLRGFRVTCHLLSADGPTGVAL